MDRRTARSALAALHDAQNRMYAGGDVEPLRALLSRDIEWHVPGENPIAGVYRGVEEVLGYFRHRRELAANTLRLDPGEILVGDRDHIAVLTDGFATISGLEHRWSTIGLYRLGGRRINACWLLPFDQSQFDRIWSA
jgi:uncharacterized protein